MPIKYKNPIVSSSVVTVTSVGPDYPFKVYLFADVLEELVFYAAQKGAWGLLGGRAYMLEVDKAQSGPDRPDNPPSPEGGGVDKPLSGFVAAPDERPDYVEVTSFSEIYPCDGALDFASHLRKTRNFRNSVGVPALGPVCLASRQHALMLEDLLLQRSYFAGPTQFMLFVGADRKPPRAFVLDDTLDHLIEAGVSVVSAAGAALPFDADDA